MTDLEPLLAALREGQRIGAIGPLSLDDAVHHSMRFVDAIDDDAESVIDLGSGGGLPGLVIGWCRPDLRVTLVDRRSKRTDYLGRAVRRLGLNQRVAVINAEVQDLGRRSEHANAYATATARSFGPPETTVRLALPLLAAGGQILISDPPGPDRWSAIMAGELGKLVAVIRTGCGLTALRRC